MAAFEASKAFLCHPPLSKLKVLKSFVMMAALSYFDADMVVFLTCLSALTQVVPDMRVSILAK
jgi:hypothetical protein